MMKTGNIRYMRRGVSSLDSQLWLRGEVSTSYELGSFDP
jgi:hypothetical protein